MSDPVKPPPKRRRILDPSTIVSVPVYTNQVRDHLNLKMRKPSSSVRAESLNTGDGAEAAPSPPVKKEIGSITISSDSEEEEDEADCVVQEESQAPADIRPPCRSRSPSPPPPMTEMPKLSRSAKKTLNKLNRQKAAILAPSPDKPRGRQLRRGRRGPAPPQEEEQQQDGDNEDDDIIPREIPLKVRYGMALHRIPVLSSAPLSKVVDVLSLRLKVPNSRILLLKNETELPHHKSVNELGLGIADILECEVDEDQESNITVRLQGKQRDSTKEYQLHKEAPLGSVMTKYISTMSGAASNVQFFFDGNKIHPNHTPKDLDMEDGDVIEVWV